MNDWKRILIVALGVPLLLVMGFGIKDKINEGGERNARLYNTAIQATETGRFNYAIDSRQGKLLGYGTFTATQEVKFPEMSKGFAYVEKTKEEYVQKQREVCETHYRTETRTRTVTDADGNTSTETYTEEVPYEVCHTETYYEWDYAGSDELSTPAFKLHGREYPAAAFALGGYKHSTDPCKFTPANTAGWLQEKNGCDDGYYYTDNDTRYDYRVLDMTFKAGFIADVTDGTLKPLSGSQLALRDATPEQMVKEANDYGTAGTVFIVMWFIVVLGSFGALGYAWASSDGIWSSKN